MIYHHDEVTYRNVLASISNFRGSLVYNLILLVILWIDFHRLVVIEQIKDNSLDKTTDVTVGIF